MGHKTSAALFIPIPVIYQNPFACGFYELMKIFQTLEEFFPYCAGRFDFHQGNFIP